MRIYVETTGDNDFNALAQRIAEKVKSVIGFTPIVKIVEVGVLITCIKDSGIGLDGLLVVRLAVGLVALTEKVGGLRMHHQKAESENRERYKPFHFNYNHYGTLTKVGDSVESLVVNGLHLVGGVARGETRHVEGLEGLHDAGLLFLRNLTVGKNLTDSVAAEVGQGNIVFVGKTAPQGVVHLFVESVLVTCVQQCRRLFQPFASLLGGTAEAHACHILHSRLTTSQKEAGSERDKHEQYERDDEPDRDGVLVFLRNKSRGARLDVVDVGVEQSDIVLAAGDMFHGVGVATVHTDRN